MLTGFMSVIRQKLSLLLLLNRNKKYYKYDNFDNTQT